MVQRFVSHTKENGFFEKNRQQQNKNWFLQTVDEYIKQFFHQKETFKKEQAKLLTDIESNKISPFYAAKLLLDKITKEL
jgi:LAO/AO transport system kinase